MFGYFLGTTKHAAMAFAALVTASLGVYLVLWLIDFGPFGMPPWALIVQPGAVDTLLSFSEVTVAILGAAITVSAIIVELSANRYTPRITEFFVRDPVNGIAMSFYVVTSVIVLWVNLSLYGDTYPHAMALVSASLMSVSLISVIPYFVYVFDFLGPERVIYNMQRQATDAIYRVHRYGQHAIAWSRDDVLAGIEQLGDITLNSVDKKDKPIAIATINALAEVARASLELKSECPDDWFDSEVLVQKDQDFIALHPNMVRVLTHRHTWVEMKVFRQYQAAFDASANKVRDVCHLIAIETRRVAFKAWEHGDRHAFNLAVRFLNTYMRTAINSGDVRTAYNLLNEYRVLAEKLLDNHAYEDVEHLAVRIRFYGQLAFGRNLAFILESAGYDLCSVIEKAHDQGAPCHDALLDIFLELDREPEGGKTQEASLRGVRKSQIKLATHYLARGSLEPARRIFKDMAHERVERLVSIRGELESVTEEEYWEVSDRGINFEWLSPERRAQLATFFGWFQQL